MVDAADIERSCVGVSGFGFSQEAIDAKLRHAPQWVLDNVRAARAAAGSDGAIASKSPLVPAATSQRTSQRWAGWVAGIACCGVSNPAPLLKRDERRPEQFIDDCLRKLFKQGNSGSTATELRWGHEGPVLATSENRDVLFTIEPHFFGLEFQARLADNEENRRILREIGGRAGRLLPRVPVQGWPHDGAGRPDGASRHRCRSASRPLDWPQGRQGVLPSRLGCCCKRTP
jgi:hypothetical protein